MDVTEDSNDSKPQEFKDDGLESQSSSSNGSDVSIGDESTEDLVTVDEAVNLEAVESLIDEKIKTNDVNYLQSLIMRLNSDDIELSRKIKIKVLPILSPYRDFWKCWIDDEISKAENLEGSVNVLELFEVALDKIYSISIWTRFVSFIVKKFLSTDLSTVMSEDDVRGVCLRAVNATKGDFMRGIKVWKKYIAFERKLIEACDNPKKRESQLLRIRKAYIDQLHVPHKDLEDTFNSYSAFETSNDIENYEHNLSHASTIVSKTRKVCKEFQRHEDELIATSYHTLVFDDYLEFLRSYKSDTGAIFTLYERALKKYYFQEYFWSSYIIELVIHLFRRPLLSLLSKKNIQRKKNGRFQDEIHDSFKHLAETAESAYALLECIRIMQEYYIRELNSADSTVTPEFINNNYQEGVNLIFERFGKSDCIVELVMHAIRFNMYKILDDNKARSLYDFVCKEYPHKSALWIGYSQLELSKNEYKKAVSILKDALMRKTDYPESIVASLKSIESEIRSVDDYYNTMWVIQKELVKINHRKQKEYSLNYEKAQKQQQESSIIDHQNHSITKRKRQAMDNDDFDVTNIKETKSLKDMKSGTIDVYSYHEISNKNAGCMIYITNLPYRTDEDKLKNVFSQCGRIIDIIIQVDKSTGNIEAYIEFSNATEVRSALVLREEVDIDGQPIKIQRCKPIQNIWDYPMTSEPNKIYISNLPTSIMKKHLRDVFSRFGKIVDISLVLRKKTAFAYLEFETSDSANSSLSMNGESFILGYNQIISVLISDPHKAKLPKSIDMREIFVNNLPYNLQIEDIKQLFDKFGKNEVRIPLDKNGQPRGFAFVSFENKDSAAKALSINSTIFQGRIINVTISDHIHKEKKFEKKLLKKRIASKSLERKPLRSISASSSVLKATVISNKSTPNKDSHKQESVSLQLKMDVES